MIDYVQARKNMVDCQIHTSGVVHAGLLEAFETVPREIFVPESLHGIAYYDDPVELGQGRFLLDPLTLSKMLQAAELKDEDVVLDIGGATGYCAAILSSNVSTIIALESNETFLKTAEKDWSELGACNIVAVHDQLSKGVEDKGPYDLIIMHGAVPEIPINIADQLTEDGRMLCIIKNIDSKVGRATLVRSTSDTIGKNRFSSYTLFECGVPYLEGFAPKPAFSF